jgi:uncharacterized RDD family membrane protein YckC
MPCAICGDICRCSVDADSTRSPRWQNDEHSLPDAGGSLPSIQVVKVEESCAQCEPELALPCESAQVVQDAQIPERESTWRLEVSQRLNRYHSRRKPRPPRYPSLRLKFDVADAVAPSSSAVDSRSFPHATSRPSNHAFALDQFSDVSHATLETAPFDASEMDEACLPQPDVDGPDFVESPGSLASDLLAPVVAPQTTAKIIEFPRSWTPPAPPLDELAEPVMSRPRILEAPEIVPPPPALGGIIIDPAPRPEFERRPGIDFPLQSAPLAQRILSALLDSLIIAAACGLFGFIFWKLTGFRPPRVQLVGMAAGACGLFWAAYQYLLLVYSGATPGLRLARLKLARFDGSLAGRRLRRWRVLASFLSAASLGMGYAWVFLDEDSLCWHDRITHTYLGVKQSETPVEKSGEFA